MNELVVAVPVRERVFKALATREQQKLAEQRAKIAEKYAKSFVELAESLLAFKITGDLQDEDFADVDRLLYSKVSLMTKFRFRFFLPCRSCGSPCSAGGNYLNARRRLRKLYGENFLPYDAVRKAASGR